MATEKQMQQARLVYSTLINTFKLNNWAFQETNNDFFVKTGFKNGDNYVRLGIRVIPEKELVVLLAPLPCPVPKEKRVELATAITVANFEVLDGSFIYNFADGSIIFKLTWYYCGCEPNENLFAYMTSRAVSVVGAYNDRFLMLSEGRINIQQFIEMEKKEENKVDW